MCWLRWKRICVQRKTPGLDPWVRKTPWRRELQPIPIFLPGEFHGQRSCAGYSPWGCKDSDMTEQLTLHFTSWVLKGFPGDLAVKNLPANAGDMGLIPGSGKIPWRREWQPTPVFLLGKFHGQRRLAGYSPWDHKERGMTERLNHKRQTLKTRSSPRPCSHRRGSWGHSVHSGPGSSSSWGGNHTCPL